MAGQKVLALDLETIRDEAKIPLLPDVKVNKSLRDPVKIAADISQKKANQVEGMSLNPLFNLICSAAWCDKNGAGVMAIQEGTQAEEKILIEAFWDILSKYDHFVTFNGRSFDMRCLYLHGAMHGIRPPIKIDNGRYNRGNHTDLRLVLSGSDQYAPGKLDTYLQLILGYGKMEGIDGAMVQEYFDMGLIGDIAGYNEDDAKKTFQLYQAVERAGMLE